MYKIKIEKIVIRTTGAFYHEFIGEKVKEIVAGAGIKTGSVTVMTTSTNGAVTVTENLECIISDYQDLMSKLADYDGAYSHAHFLPTYGRTSANAYAHLRSLLTGNQTSFPILDGKMAMGDAQDIVYFEWDGPQDRTVYVTVQGEDE